MDIDLLLGGQLQVQPNGTFGYVMFSQNRAQQNFPVACHAQLVTALNGGGVDSPNGITFGSKTGVQAKTFTLSSTTTSSLSSTVTTSSSSASSSGTTISVSVSSPTSSQPLVFYHFRQPRQMEPTQEPKRGLESARLLYVLSLRDRCGVLAR
jgi:hypothetical protein